MKGFLIVLLAVGIPALANASVYTSEQNVNVTDAGTVVDYFTCEAQGNFADPQTCDCYIACTASLTAYQMPCPMGHDGRLYYVRDSGPSEQTSRCDEPSKVECDLEPTEPPPSGSVNGTCPDGLKDGDACDPIVDCNQCGFCDWYFYCHADSPTSGKWRRNDCSVRGDPDTEVIRTEDKMFFHRWATSYGGICAPGVPKDQEDEYVQDPSCKLPCEFRADANCNRAYWYSDPDYTRGIWSDPGTQLLCPEGTKWSQHGLTCVFCDKDETCDCNGKAPAKAKH